jgi:hypothetical protein
VSLRAFLGAHLASRLDFLASAVRLDKNRKRRGSFLMPDGRGLLTRSPCRQSHATADFRYTRGMTRSALGSL